MKPEQACILQVALNTPLRTHFDYLPPDNFPADKLQPGIRLRVPFGRSTHIGLLLAISNVTEVSQHKLKPVLEVLDDTPLFSTAHLDLLKWSSRYYHHPIGEVIAASLPGLIRQGRSLQIEGVKHWICTTEGFNTDLDSLKRAPRQQSLLARLQAHHHGLSADALNPLLDNWRAAARNLLDKGLISLTQAAPEKPERTDCLTGPELTTAQQAAVDRINASLEGFQVHLLEGVTGSGKTEVYFQAIERVLQKGLQVLVLIPEISLSKQTIQRFQLRFHQPLAILHSGLSDQERTQAWLAARNGSAPIVIGTRSASWTPTQALGLIIIDEEHDASYKQQEGFRYSARDVSIVRARNQGIPVILGSATPSLESFFNLQQGKYSHLQLPERTGLSQLPELILHDIRNLRLEEGISPHLIARVREKLQLGQQSLIFINRRGYSPLVMCHQCGWTPTCGRCDMHLTYHKRTSQLICHHCAAEQPYKAHCAECNSSEIITIGCGTEKVVEHMQKEFPDARVIRIDRDSTRRKGSLEKLLNEAESGHADILVGTQMLSKGHHFPHLTLVGILDADSRLYSADFRAGERLAQLILQVSGRAGRVDQAGQVIIQTHHPDHPLLIALQQHDYSGLMKSELEERRNACLPPCTSLALLRAESANQQQTQTFLQAARSCAQRLRHEKVELLGPIPAPMEKRAGRFRGQLLLQSEQRRDLHKLLTVWVAQLSSLPSARSCRWSLDVDPYEML